MSDQLNPDIASTANALTEAYCVIWEQHMQDVPVINPSLKVQAIDFQLWQSFYLGVLITPWFMNLVLIPQDQHDWQNKHVGEKFSYVFDAGEFEFILGQTEGVGYLLSCSLFSPMFEFEDHQAAVATAEAVMTAIFNAENQDSDQAQSLEPVAKPSPSRVAINAKALSRRDFFRGKFLSTSQPADPASLEEQS